ncbi:MMPL family transporter [Kurthia massiliensis]|uniref:MMPL family transporter n=1 Tax=Kurthia massiliensis TaxID=1033739 RepID=UPI000287C71F|nr:MMPL family transporter [Kurthia massiliensis]
MKKHPLEAWGQMVASKKGRWLSLIFWILLVAVVSFSWPQINSVDNVSSENLADTEMSKQAAKMVEEQFPDDSGTPLLLVWHREDGLTEKDLAKVQALYSELEKNPVQSQSLVPPFGNLPPQALMESVSENGSTLVTPVFFEKGASTEQFEEGMNDITKLVKDDASLEGDYTKDELNLRYTGPVAISVDATGLFASADVKLMIATVLLVLVLLIIIYRSPLLAIIPLIAVGLAYGVISPALGFMAEQGWIDKDAQAVSIMTVLLFGAGTDYCLFLISKYREILLEVEDKGKAMAIAMKESSGAILMSALTVVVGLATLGLANYGTFDRFAVPFSFGVLIMGITALVVLPAILVLIGRAAFWPFVPRTEEAERARAEKRNKPFKQHRPKHKWSAAVGDFVTKKPIAIIIATVVFLGSLAAFAPKIQFTFDILSSFPEDMTSREGYTLVEENFSPGELAPVQVVVDTDGQDVDLQKGLGDLGFIDVAGEKRVGEKDDNIQLYELSLDDNPYSAESLDHIPEIKDKAIALLKDAGVEKADEKVWIGGETASQYDEMQVIADDESLIMPVIIAFIALLLLVYLHSITATLYLMATVILSYFSALGLGWIVLHYGMGIDAIQGSIPLYTFVFSVALGVDYNIFMVSEIWQRRKNKPLKQSVSEGVKYTGSVITSAGLILAGTFAVLATLPIQVLVQFGVITALGVLLDTFIVRPLLVPAITTVLGRYAFWPGKLWKKPNDK